MSESRYIPVRSEADIINARLITRQMAKDAGLPIMDQARISLAVSSLAHIIRLGECYTGQVDIHRITEGGRSGLQVTWTLTADCDVNGVLRDLNNSTLNTMVHKLDVEASPDTGVLITALMWKL